MRYQYITLDQLTPSVQYRSGMDDAGLECYFDFASHFVRITYLDISLRVKAIKLVQEF